MYNRPMCGRSSGTYKNLGDLQRDLRGLVPPHQIKKIIIKKAKQEIINAQATSRAYRAQKTRPDTGQKGNRIEPCSIKLSATRVLPYTLCPARCLVGYRVKKLLCLVGRLRFPYYKCTKVLWKPVRRSDAATSPTRLFSGLSKRDHTGDFSIYSVTLQSKIFETYDI
jgi:hypothetical protein